MGLESRTNNGCRWTRASAISWKGDTGRAAWRKCTPVHSPLAGHRRRTTQGEETLCCAGGCGKGKETPGRWNAAREGERQNKLAARLRGLLTSTGRGTNGSALRNTQRPAKKGMAVILTGKSGPIRSGQEPQGVTTESV